jgi:hypothetical protein
MRSIIVRLCVVVIALISVVSCLNPLPSPEKIAAAFRPSSSLSSPEASTTQLRAGGDVAILDMEIASTRKYLNLFSYGDENCEAVVWAMYLPLNQCLPNVVWQGLVSGNFLKWSCTSSVCVAKSYSDSGCTKFTSGTHRVTSDIPSGCSTDAEGFVAVKYEFSATMPTHSSGLVNKLYRANDCTGTHVSFYTPDSCSESDGGSTYTDCETGTYRQYTSSTECGGDYTLLSLSERNDDDYDNCVAISTGGSSTDVCGGIGSIKYFG